MNAEAMKNYLNTDGALAELAAIYGGEAQAQRGRYRALVDAFVARFGDRDGALLCSAPGRTEIAGNHTDHQNGRVLAAAVSLDTVCCIAPRDDMKAELWSEGYDRPFCVDLSDLSAQSGEEETTLALIRGVAARMAQLGHRIGGFDAVATSTVFKGSGLSSSAAFEVMLVAALDALYGGFGIDAQQRALISKFAENNYFGKPCGLMDQMASSVGGLVMMDFKEPEARIEALQCDFAEKGYAMCVVSAGGEHGNLTSEYAAIPQEMRDVARALGKEVLREVDPAELEARIPELKGAVSDRAILRALHFCDEDARIPALVDAIKNDDIGAFLGLIVASGNSSQCLLQNLYVPGRDNQEMGLALELSRRMLSGDGAWRIHGGGFAGTILVFVPMEKLGAYRARLDSVFGAGATTLLSVRPCGPAVIGLNK